MNRKAWLAQRRSSAEEQFDTLYAPTYDQDDVPITPTHRRLVPPIGRVVLAGRAVLEHRLWHR